MYPGFTAVVSIVALSLCFISAMILLIFPKEYVRSRKILGAYFLDIGFAQCVLFLVTSGLIEQVPHLFRTGVLVAYVFPPLAYLYTRENFKPGFTYWDLIHFAPALFYIVDFLPFFISSADEKLAIIRSVAGDNIDQLFAHREGWLTPPWFHMVARTLLAVSYSVLSFRLMRRVTSAQHSDFSSHPGLQKWLWTFVILQVFIFLPYIALVILGKPQLTFYTTTIPFVVIVTAVSVVLFLKPSILYGLDGSHLQSRLAADRHGLEETRSAEPGEDVSGAQASRPSRAKPRTTLSEYLSGQEADHVGQLINSFLSESRPYLSHNYSINDLSKAIGVPARKISAYVNGAEHTNFRDLLNRLRIEYCVANLTDRTWQNLTLEAIAQRCGFNNRNSFTNAFKRFTGTYPSSYINDLKQGQTPGIPVNLLETDKTD